MSPRVKYLASSAFSMIKMICSGDMYLRSSRTYAMLLTSIAELWEMSRNRINSLWLSLPKPSAMLLMTDSTARLIWDDISKSFDSNPPRQTEYVSATSCLAACQHISFSNPSTFPIAFNFTPMLYGLVTRKPKFSLQFFGIDGSCAPAHRTPHLAHPCI